MQRIIPILVSLSLLMGAFLSSGCAVYDASVDPRTVGTYIDDEKISFIVEKRFLEDDLVKYMDFDADSFEGHVYIIGEYESREQVDRAVSLAKTVEGVHRVTTYMLPKKVDDVGCGTTDNFDLYRRVTKRLVDDKDIWSTNIKVETIQCHVVLLGIVGSSKEKAAAYAHAVSTPGARSVKSYLTVKQ